MKNLVTVVMLLLVTITFGQDSKINKSFVTKTSVVVYAYDPITEKYDKDLFFLLNDDIKFYVYKVLDEGYVISVWDFKQTPEKDTLYKQLPFDNIKSFEEKPVGKKDYYRMSKSRVGLKPGVPADNTSPFVIYNQLAYVDYWGNNMQFFIPLKDFDENCENIFPATRSFTWGFLTLPIKMRFGSDDRDFTFEEKINFGLAFGIKFQRPTTTYTAHNLLIGVSVSNVKTGEESSAAALSFSGGYMYQYDKFQVGIFTGFDYVAGSQGKEFDYQGKPWLGLAIGVSLFGENKLSAEASNSTNANE